MGHIATVRTSEMTPATENEENETERLRLAVDSPGDLGGGEDARRHVFVRYDVNGPSCVSGNRTPNGMP